MEQTTNIIVPTKKGVRFTSEDSRSQNEEVYNATLNGYTPKVTDRVQYKDPKERLTGVLACSDSSITRPNCEDILRRVSVVILQHIEKCEARLARAVPETYEQGLYHSSKMSLFSEENFLSPQYVYHFVRQPISRMGFLYGIRKADNISNSPTLSDVHTFISDLFIKAQLSAECSIVCLIYVERLMENANVPLVSTTWRPVLLCGLLLASKVWQDLSSWNVEIAQIYPQFSLQSINKLERQFCSEIKWDLYISSSAYAKYYFALRSLTEKRDFRQQYNIMMVNAPGAASIAIRSVSIKQTFLETTLSKSL